VTLVLAISFVFQIENCLFVVVEHSTCPVQIYVSQSFVTEIFTEQYIFSPSGRNIYLVFIKNLTRTKSVMNEDGLGNATTNYRNLMLCRRKELFSSTPPQDQH
jgi:hypothetical protein